MAERREVGSRKRRSDAKREPASPPIPMGAVDLLAGLAPDVELTADDLPPGLEAGNVANGPIPATTTVAETGKLLRSGDSTIRRLIRSAGVRPAAPPDGAGERLEPDRAGVLPRTPDKPGE